MDYVNEVLKMRSIDKNIYNQINNNFEVINGYMGIRFKKKYDGNPKMDYYIMYFMFDIKNDISFVKNYKRKFDGVDNDIKNWINHIDNGLEFNAILVSEYVMLNMAKFLKPFEDKLKDVPNYVIEEWSMIPKWVYVNYPTLNAENRALSRIWSDIKWGEQYKSTFPMVDIRDEYIEKEKVRRKELYDELNKYLIDNDIKMIFNMIVKNFLIDINFDKDIIVCIKFTYNKCNIDGHNIDDDIISGRFVRDFNLDDLNKFAFYDRNAIIASLRVKIVMREIKSILILRGPELCDVLVNNNFIDIMMKQTFMLVSKYFNDMVKNVNVKFEHDSIVGCKEGCGNKILICCDSVMNSLPRCEECEGGKIYYKGSYILPNNWAQCSMCKCLFFVPYDDDKYYGKNPKCEICRVK